MIAHLDVYGVYVPSLLILLLASYVAKSLVCRVLTRVGFYRWVWHPPLFNLALYIMLTGALFTLSHGVNS